jgi:hypothetical protein
LNLDLVECAELSGRGRASIFKEFEEIRSEIEIMFEESVRDIEIDAKGLVREY